MNCIASHLYTETGEAGAGTFVTEADAIVSVGNGKPGVAEKPVCVEPAVSVKAEAV